MEPPDRIYYSQPQVHITLIPVAVPGQRNPVVLMLINVIQHVGIQLGAHKPAEQSRPPMQAVPLSNPTTAHNPQTLPNPAAVPLSSPSGRPPAGATVPNLSGGPTPVAHSSNHPSHPNPAHSPGGGKEIPQTQPAPKESTTPTKNEQNPNSPPETTPQQRSSYPLEKLLNLFHFRIPQMPVPTFNLNPAGVPKKEVREEFSQPQQQTQKNSAAAQGQDLPLAKPAQAEQVTPIAKSQTESKSESYLPPKSQTVSPEPMVAPMRVPQESLARYIEPNMQVRYAIAGMQIQQAPLAKGEGNYPRASSTPANNVSQTSQNGNNATQIKPQVNSSTKNETLPLQPALPSRETTDKLPLVPQQIPINPRDPRLHVKPRVDAINKLEHVEGGGAIVIPGKPDDRDIVRIPIPPDQPLSKEGMFKRNKSQKNKKLHIEDGFRLGDLILMLLMATVAGARTPTEIQSYIDANDQEFAAWLNLKQGLPTHKMWSQLLGHLQTDALLVLLKAVVRGGSNSLQKMAIWESERGVILAQLADESDRLSLEDALGLWDLGGALLQIDHAVLAPAIASEIVRKGGFYLYGVKNRHGRTFDQIQDFFEGTLKPQLASHRHQQKILRLEETGHLEERRLLTTDYLEWFEERDVWPELTLALLLETEIVSSQTVQRDKRFFFSNLNLETTQLEQKVRLINMAQGKAHWIVDSDFTTSHKDHTLQNRACLQRYAENLMAHKGPAPKTLTKLREVIFNP